MNRSSLDAARCGFGFEHTYARCLPDACVESQPSKATDPRLLFWNESLADEFQVDMRGPDDLATAQTFAGNALPPGAMPVAQAYAGHQFGRFVPELGDGRALLLGEVIDRAGCRRDIAFKGSGRTPFSKGGDGKAAVGPMLREALVGEAMHALGVPTTRALAVVATGDLVFRERVLPGAVLTRVAASHVRVGTFQYLAARGDVSGLRRLLDYTIDRHYAELIGSADPVFELLRSVIRRQAELVAQWMNLGFVHGVMNTDNMTLSGETIDYGPCAFLEHYDPSKVFSSIDTDGRYAYGNQARVAKWNLARLAESLLPLVADEQDDASMQRAIATATDLIGEFPMLFDAAMLRGQRAKLGLFSATTQDDAADASLASTWMGLLQAQQVDFTLAWRRLADVVDGRADLLRSVFTETSELEGWLSLWQARLARDQRLPAQTRSAGMRRASPWIVPRNHQVERVLALATDGQMREFFSLLEAVRRPFDQCEGCAYLAEPAPAAVASSHRTFCGT